MSTYGKVGQCLYPFQLMNAQHAFFRVGSGKICRTRLSLMWAPYHRKMHDAHQPLSTLPAPHNKTWNYSISCYVKNGKPLNALCLYVQQIQSKYNSPPNAHCFVAVLKACVMLQDLEMGRKVHAHISEAGFLHNNKFVSSTLVDLYAKCNSLADAKRVFDMLQGRDVVAWTAIVGAYAELGDADSALTCFQEMQHAGVFPNAVTYICSLKACTILRNVVTGQELHTEIERQGLLEKDVNLGNSLVGMYAKCGCFSKAHEVFDRLPVRNVVTWTALVGGYVENSCNKEALQILERMKKHDVAANSVTLLCGLKACGSLKGLGKGREIHAEVEKHGWSRKDENIGNAVVDMYAKCGSLVEAQKLFDSLPLQNKVSWSTLISGYTENGRADIGLTLFRRMCSAGIFPDAVVYLSCLKACASMGALAQGQDIHAEIERQGFLEAAAGSYASAIGNALVDMYAKCGSLAKSEEVFEGIPVRSLVSWNALLSGYVEGGYAMEAMQNLEKMRLEGLCLDAVTHVCGLKACMELGFIDKGIEIHAEIDRQGLLAGNLSIGNTLVDMYAGVGLPGRAQQIFDMLQDRNVVSWNALMSGYIEHGDNEEAIECFKQMQLEGVFADVITYMCALKACSSLLAIEIVVEIHEELERRSLIQGSLDVGNTLIDTYAKCSRLEMARHVFKSLNVLDAVSWNALIAGYTEHGQDEVAITCYEQMLARGFSPDSVTFICVLKALGTVGVIGQGEEIHAELERLGLLGKNVVVSSTLVDMYAKCGLLRKAQSVFDKLSVRGVIAWTSLMSGYAQLGQCQNVFVLFDKMVGESVKPDMVTFVIVLSVCSRAGLFGKSQMYFEAMSEVYGIVPSMEHRTSIVDVLARTGELGKAMAMVNIFSASQNFVAWHAVLSACKRWGNAKVGKQAFEQALCLDGNYTSACLLRSPSPLDEILEAEKYRLLQ